jgi:DNA-binding transcriptional MerR regulator
VSSRTYLSIGDVLTLLREEFPDVTISKIRFLESQGLVNPERSPSGYRKFFETDVERLRWVLRQQREHFLPLKVIRDRLANGDLSEDDLRAGEVEQETADVVTHTNGRVPEPAHAAASGASGGSTRPGGLGPGRSGSRAASASHGPGTQSPGQTQADDEAMARILADASRRVTRPTETIGEGLLHAVPDAGAPAAPTHTEVPPAIAAAPATPATAQAPAPAPASASAPAAAVPAAPVTSSAGTDREALAAPAPHNGPAPTPPTPAGIQSAPAPRTPRHLAPDSVEAPATDGVDHGPAPAPAKSTRAQAVAAATAPASAPEARAAEPAPRDSAAANPAAKPAGTTNEKRAAVQGAQAPSTSGMVTGASLTAAELCAASGLSEAELTGLQGFGLVEPVLVAGIPTFDEDDLTVASLAAEFRKYGIEARHLRPYRNAVDREVGLIEQVIIPLLRQRNPESRQRAVAAADELTALGQTMRATLMRTALRRHVGG